MEPALPETEPSLHCGILRVWIHGRQFPESLDYWDGNWLIVTAHCAAAGASVLVNGPVLHLSEIEQWRRELVALNELLKGTAILPTIEPYLRLKLTCNHLGQVTGICHITADLERQEHRFQMDLDQTYLPHLVAQCDRILETYAVRGTP